MDNFSSLSKGKLKIALICDWYLPRIGGLEIYLHDLAQRLSQAGNEVHVVTSIPGPECIEGVRVHRLNVPLAPRFKFIYTPNAFRKIKSLLEKENYDVVHCHSGIVAPVAHGGLYLSQKLGIPALITWRSILGPFRQTLRVLDKFVSWSSWPVLFSAVSATAASDIAVLVGPRPVHVLHNGIDSSKWKVVPVNRDPREILVASSMRLNRKKRGVALIKIIAKVMERIPGDHSLKVKIIGEGPERPRIEKWIKRLSLEKTVELVGYQPRHVIRKIFAQTDIYIQPTIWESFGIAALEARSAGLPIIAREQGGVKEFIEDGREGLLAKTDGEMEEHLVRMILEPELRSTMAKNNLETPPPENWETVILRHLTLYQMAMDLRNNRMEEKSSGKKL